MQRLAVILVILALSSPSNGAVAQQRGQVFRVPSRVIAQPCVQQAAGLRTRVQAMARALRGVIVARDAVLRSNPESRANRLIELQSALNGLHAAAALARDDGWKWAEMCGAKSGEPRTLQEINAVMAELRAALSTLAALERPSRLRSSTALRTGPIYLTHNPRSVEICHAYVSAPGRCRPQDLNTCQNCCSALPPNVPGRAQCVQGCQSRIAECTLDSMPCGLAGACRAMSAPPVCDCQPCASCCDAKCPGAAYCSVACDLRSTQCRLDAIVSRQAESPSIFVKP